MKKIILFALIIILSGTCIAQPAFVTGATTSGYSLKFPLKDVFKLNEAYNFEIHVFNQTNGIPITSGIGCAMHLYNQTGNHIFTGYQNITSKTYDYEFSINQNNFSTLGQYYYYIQCNSTIQGGYEGSYIYVTAQGVPYTTTHGLVYLGLFALLISIFIMLIFFIFSIDTDNKRDDDGAIIKINRNKYIRIFLVAIAYTLFIAMNYFAWNIAYGILEFTEMASFFMFLFRTSFIMMYPIFIVIIVWSIAQYIKDKKVEEFIKRNLSFK